ncbi:hypothetical protein ACXO2A_05390 [Lactobacillus delbrueckii subsp. bulgaricus]
MIKIMLFAVSMCLIFPLIAGSVEASTNKSLSANRLNSINTEYKIDSTKWSDEKIDQLVKALSELHPELSNEYLRELVESQLNDEAIPNLTNRDISPSLALRANLARSTKSSWKGITVAQMGAVIDTIIGTVIGGGLSSITKAGLKAAVKKMGRKKLSRLVRQHLLRKFSAAYIISSKVIETALNYTSPGTWVAKYWDKYDAYPNNGRINF